MTGAIRVLWNPNAGSKAGLPTNHTSEDDLRDLMRRHGLGEELIATRSVDEAVERARDAVRRSYGVVVAAGGDGTVFAIARELLGTQTALGILPLGSAMNVTRSLAIPRDLEAAAAIIAKGDTRSIDVGEANGEVFLEVASIGFSAAIFADAQRFDRGEYSSVLALLKTVLRYRPVRMRIDLGTRVIATRALMISVGNGPFTGLGFTLAPDARLDDGQFDVRVFERSRNPSCCAISGRSASADAPTHQRFGPIAPRGCASTRSTRDLSASTPGTSAPRR